MKLGQKLRKIGIKQIQVPKYLMVKDHIDYIGTINGLTLYKAARPTRWNSTCRGIRKAVKYYDDMGR